MKRAKRLVIVLAVALVLISGAVTVYAMSADGEKPQPVQKVEVLEDYAAEEMAVGAYYENWMPEPAAEAV